jgi:hypothetical protein
LIGATASLTGSGDVAYVFAGSSLTVAGTGDLFVFSQAFGQSTLAGFGTGDVLQLSAQDWTSFAALQQSGDLQETNSGAAILKLDANDQITLTGVQASSLTAAQFVFR